MATSSGNLNSKNTAASKPDWNQEGFYEELSDKVFKYLECSNSFIDSKLKNSQSFSQNQKIEVTLIFASLSRKLISIYLDPEEAIAKDYRSHEIFIG